VSESSPNILVLCADDVCLAPAAADQLRASLQFRDRGHVAVRSAGIRALEGRPWCPESRHLVRVEGCQAGEHLARQVTSSMVRQADLVLTTERRFRGAGRMLDVHSAGRTFTILEAAALARAAMQGAGVQGAGDRRGPHPGHESLDSPLGALVDEMDFLRGLVTLPAPPSAWRTRFSRTPVRGPDVVDPHGAGGSHRRALDAMHEACLVLADAVAWCAQSAMA